MSAERLVPEVREAIAKLPSLPFHIIPLLPITRFLFNLAARSPVASGISVSTVRQGRLKLRIYQPDDGGSGAGIVWCFGGGHIAGKAEHVNPIAKEIIEATGATVFAADYRLSPKHPFPADHDDCFAAWTYMTEHAETYGIDVNRLAVGGHSAGGGLAAGLAQRIYDTGGPQPKAQILYYPMLDDRTAADTSKDDLETFLWENKTNRVAWGVYLAPHKPGASDLPDYAAPARREDLSGLAPAWVGYGDIDLFAEEDAAYAQRLIASRVECHEERVEGVPHAFEAIVPDAEISKAFNRSAMSFLKRKLA